MKQWHCWCACKEDENQEWHKMKKGWIWVVRNVRQRAMFGGDVLMIMINTMNTKQCWWWSNGWMDVGVSFTTLDWQEHTTFTTMLNTTQAMNEMAQWSGMEVEDEGASTQCGGFKKQTWYFVIEPADRWTTPPQFICWMAFCCLKMVWNVCCTLTSVNQFVDGHKTPQHMKLHNAQATMLGWKEQKQHNFGLKCSHNQFICCVTNNTTQATVHSTTSHSMVNCCWQWELKEHKHGVMNSKQTENSLIMTFDEWCCVKETESAHLDVFTFTKQQCNKHSEQSS